MITNSDIDGFYLWCINKNIDVKRTKEKYHKILKLINTMINTSQITIDVENKFCCLKDIIEKILSGHTIDSAVSNVATAPKNSGVDSEGNYILFKYNEQATDEQLNTAIKIIDCKFKFISILENKPKYEKLFNDLNDDKYGSIDEGFEMLSNLSYELSNDIRQTHRAHSMASESCILIGNNEDELKKMLNKKRDKYNRINKIPTGFEYIDNNILLGGFEKSRLYIIGGSSGSGKSTFLTNTCYNAVKYEGYVGELKRKKKFFLYLTLENDKEETIGRIMCTHWGISDLQLERMLTEDLDGTAKKFNNEMKNYEVKNNTCLDIRQFNTESISASSIAAMIDDIVENNGGKENCLVAAIYIDYLDLIRSDCEKNDLRVNLTQITKELKDLAREYEIPVITATQLNREGYNISSAYQLSAKAMGESMGKIHIADFVAMISKDPLSNERVFWNVVKFRSGNSGSPLDFRVNFEHFKFIDCVKSKVTTRSSAESTEPKQFDGLLKMEDKLTENKKDLSIDKSKIKPIKTNIVEF